MPADGAVSWRPGIRPTGHCLQKARQRGGGVRGWVGRVGQAGLRSSLPGDLVPSSGHDEKGHV